MTIKTRHQGYTRTIAKVRVMVSGVLRTAKTIRAFQDGSLQTVYSIASPISVVAEPPEIYTLQYTPSPQSVLSDPVTAVVSGGAGPFTYVWSVQTSTHTLSVTDPTGATSRFHTVLYNETCSATVRCNVTDSLGSTATCTVEISLTAFDFLF